jgi:hypothetical protein
VLGARRLAGGTVTRTRAFTVHVDTRGALLPVELGDVGFPVRRVFVVSAPGQGAERGGHEVSCRELVVLISGSAKVEVRGRSDRPSETVALVRPGDAVALEPGEYMTYRLAVASSVLVLAEEPYGDEVRQVQP